MNKTELCYAEGNPPVPYFDTHSNWNENVPSSGSRRPVSWCDRHSRWSAMTCANRRRRWRSSSERRPSTWRASRSMSSCSCRKKRFSYRHATISPSTNRRRRRISKTTRGVCPLPIGWPSWLGFPIVLLSILSTLCPNFVSDWFEFPEFWKRAEMARRPS